MFDKKILIFSSCFLAGIVFSAIVNKKIKNNAADIAEDILKEPEDAYASAYVRGYNAFLDQIERSDLKIDEKTYVYTSNREKSETEKDSESRAYVEGYHKAANTIYCPRSK